MAAETKQWPSLPLDEWKDTYATLHMWTQIVGKIRLVQMPWINHGWHVTLYVTSRGLTTSPIPYGNKSFQIDFDFVDHQLNIRASDGAAKSLALKPRSVADFYKETLALLSSMGLKVKINRKPNEVEQPIPFDKDTTHSAYDPEYAHRWWCILVQTVRVFEEFRARFIGKTSPIHFFWGSFDLAVTRFSGRPAPQHPGGVPNLPDWVTREAYSHEVSSCGFWPGGGPLPFPLYYAYGYPEPKGFSGATVRPAGASYNTQMHEFVLPYDDVRQARSPDTALLEFLQSTYEADANLGGWDRAALERREDPKARN